MQSSRRIAINIGGGFVPGLNAVIAGTVLAANELGWEVVGIRDGYDGLLFPERYPEGGLIKFTVSAVENLADLGGCVLGTPATSDPFHVRTIDKDNQVQELDRSDELLQIIEREKIDGVISVVGSRSLSVLWKLSRKGLKTISIPKSAENDVAATMLSFGFNSALSFATDLLERCRQAAQSAHKIGVVEVLGQHSGWLALQAGIAVCADAVLIPEIKYDIHRVASSLRRKEKNYGLVVVAEGATSVSKPSAGLSQASLKMKAALSPGSTSEEGSFVFERFGRAAAEVALDLQRLTDREAYPIVLGALAKGGAPTVVDRQLAIGSGASAVHALKNDQSGVMVVFQPPDLKMVPLKDAVNKIRVVPPDSEFVQIARSLGISLGD